MKVWPGLIVLAAFIFVAMALKLAIQKGVVVLVVPPWTPFDLGAIMLAAAAIVLTGVGIVIAILTFWGWRNIRSAAVKEAARVAERAGTDTATKLFAMYFPQDYSNAYSGTNSDDGSDGAPRAGA